MALKILKKAEIIRLKQVDHIMSEKAILQKINHPMIIALYGTSQDDFHLYMYMEFVSGGELFSHLRRAGRFTNDTGKFLAASIILALQHLHALEIIQSKGHGKAVDWWALGILIYEMLAGYPPFYDENPFGIYQKILAGKIEFPRHFDVHAKDLIKKLLTADRSKRLGNLKAGAEDVKKHKWFRNFAFKD